MLRTLGLNSALDIDALARRYREHGVVQVPDVFDETSAEQLHTVLTGSIPWRVLYTDESNRPVHHAQDEIRQMDPERFRQIMTDVLKRAQRNIGYNYLTYPMIEAYLAGWDEGHSIHRLTEFVNSDPFLALARRVTGVDEITKAEAHATAYAPGHFLTRHVDDGHGQHRRAAYVMGMTKDWQPDWGGLLLFLDDDQNVEAGFTPRFNTLTVFDISRLHTVTQVSSFAGKVRTSVAGWFRDDRPAGSGR